jgi:hypothetical protein
MLTGAHKMQIIASFDFDLLEPYCRSRDEFLNHIVIVTGDETWVSLGSTETKEQSKQWMNTHSPNKLKMFKQTLSARQLITSVSWDRKRMLMVNSCNKEPQ